MIHIEKWKDERAIEAVAAHVIATSVQRDLGERWEDYPEIGEHDWERVAEQVEEMLPRVSPTRFREAYARLEARADQEAV